MLGPKWHLARHACDNTTAETDGSVLLGAQAQADGLTTTAGLATSRERNATTTIRVRQDEAQGSKARSCPFLRLHTCGHKVNLDRNTTAGRRAAVRSRSDRERSVLTTQCGVGMTIGTTRGDGHAGRARGRRQRHLQV
jgi:hypothetical protein